MDFNNALTAMQNENDQVYTDGYVMLAWRLPSTPEENAGISCLCIFTGATWQKTMLSGEWFERDWTKVDSVL